MRSSGQFAKPIRPPMSRSLPIRSSCARAPRSATAVMVVDDDVLLWRCAPASAPTPRAAARCARAPSCAPSSRRAPAMRPPHDASTRAATSTRRFWDLRDRGRRQPRLPARAQHAVAGQRVLAFDARLVAAELADPHAIRALAAAIAAGDAAAAHDRWPPSCSSDASRGGLTRGRGPLLRDPVLRPAARWSRRSSFRHVRTTTSLVGYEARDTRTSLSMGLGQRDDQRRLEARRRSRSTPRSTS